MKPYVVGIDIGGTNTVFGIVDARGNVVASSSIKTGRHADIKDYVEELKTSLNNLLEANDATDKIAGIGVGAPNGNYFTGAIEMAPNLPWKGRIPPVSYTHLYKIAPRGKRCQIYGTAAYEGCLLLVG